MPIPPIFINFQGGQAATKSSVFDQRLKVDWHNERIFPGTRTILFEGGVVAHYGLTAIQSDALEIHANDPSPYGLATGHVRLKDPEGDMSADMIRFSWRDGTGVGTNIRITIDSVEVKADRIALTPTRYTLKGVRATGRVAGNFTLGGKFEEGEIVPGKGMRLRKPKFGFGDYLLGPFPDVRTSFNNNSSGIRFPTIGFRQGRGVGVDWSSTIALASQLRFFGVFSAYPKITPGYSAQLTQSFEHSDVTRAFAPRFDLGDRFEASYFESVLSGSPEDQYHYLGTKRETISFSRVQNVGATGRDDFGRYSKPFDLTLERSGMLGKLAAYGQVRAQEISRVGGNTQKRLVGWTSLVGPAVPIGTNLSWITRADFEAFSGSNFWWGRAQTGLVYQPISFLRLGASSFWGKESGSAIFLADQLGRTSGVSARADLITGPTKFSYLMKYDPRSRVLYDREYSVSQAIGVLETFLEYRKYPSHYQFGVRLRLDNLLDLPRKLKERK